MKALIDTNVVVDILEQREPFYRHSAAAMQLLMKGDAEVTITANMLTDIYYISRKKRKEEVCREMVKRLMELVGVIGLSPLHCQFAANSDMPDFEDAVLAYCAKGWGADYIITRNVKDFENSPVPAITPTEFLEMA